MLDIQKIRDHYKMQPHPEGGYFVETYRSEMQTETSNGQRSMSTAIHFLITEDSISHFHRLKSDEGWHYHLGDPLRVIELTPSGDLIETILGPNYTEGEKLQHFVPAGNWFASTSLGNASFVGCTVAPGFDFADFEMAKKSELENEYPKYKNIIEKYCLD